jgi:hypothetical protein
VEGRAQFETNFFRVVKMVNAVLPVMRRQQFALEGYTEALRHEVKPFNIRVPGAELWPKHWSTSFPARLDDSRT